MLYERALMLHKHWETSGKCSFSIFCFIMALSEIFHYSNRMDIRLHNDFLIFLPPPLPPSAGVMSLSAVAAVHGLGDVLQAASEPVGQLPGVVKRHWSKQKCCASENRFLLAKESL